MKKHYVSDESAGLITMRDPMFLVHEDTYYLVGTQPPYRKGENAGVHMWSTKDMVHFTDCGLILKRADMPESMWCRERFWAPELFDGKDGYFYLTFNCRNDTQEYRHIHSCGLARAKDITGPYEIITADAPITEGLGHANDASLYLDDDGQAWFAGSICGLGGQNLYKIDLSTGALSHRVYVGGHGPEGEWDHVGIEGACIVKRHGIYFHWYSSWTNGYNAGVFTSDSMEGPWVKSPQNPILDDNDIWHMAGHNHCFTGLDGKDYITFHANLRQPDGEDLERIFIRRVEYLPDGTVKVYEDKGFGEA